MRTRKDGQHEAEQPRRQHQTVHGYLALTLPRPSPIHTLVSLLDAICKGSIPPLRLACLGIDLGQSSVLQRDYNDAIGHCCWEAQLLSIGSLKRDDHRRMRREMIGVMLCDRTDSSKRDPLSPMSDFWGGCWGPLRPASASSESALTNPQPATFRSTGRKRQRRPHAFAPASCNLSLLRTCKLLAGQHCEPTRFGSWSKLAVRRGDAASELDGHQSHGRGPHPYCW